MPLSDHEKRLLDQMERALYQEDPKFASSLRSGRAGFDRKRAATGIAVLLLGLAGVIAGAAIPQPLLGVLGFITMVVGGYWGWQASAEKGADAVQQVRATAPTRSANPSSPFMTRMEERWRRRRDSGH